MGIYQGLGVTPIINASGTVTRLGGAPMASAVLAAFHEASRQTAPLEQLQAAASRRIAKHTGAEAGLVTCGSASALTLGAAAILARLDLGKMERLPHCDGFAHEMLVAREHRSGYDHAVRASGARLVEVGFNEIVANAGVRRTEAWEYEAAITPQTVGVLYVLGPGSQPPLGELVERAHAHGLPVLVDAAGELPPRRHLTSFVATGADLVCFSGGKAIRGPQSTGILCGQRELISSAALQMLDMDDHFELWDPPAELFDKAVLPGIPRHGLGRAMKVSKEEIVALLTALDLFAAGAYDADLPVFRGWLEIVAASLSETPATCHMRDPGDGESPAWLDITIDEQASGRSALEICRALRRGRPPVYVGHGRLAQGQLVIRPLCLSDEHAVELGRRLREEIGPSAAG